MANRTLTNTLTQARKDLCIDDLRTIDMACSFMSKMIELHPELVVEHSFSSWMRARCSEAETGERKGSTTGQMLEFYKDQLDSLADRMLKAPSDRA